MHRIQSYWEEQFYFKDIDVVITGGGIVGLSTGISLLEKQPGLRVLILERSPVPYGASTRNAGFACFGSPTELLDELNHHSAEEVFGLFARRYSGIQALLKRLVPLDIGYEPFGGHEVLQHDDAVSREQLDELNRMIRAYTGLESYFDFRDEYLDRYGLHGFEHCIRTSHEACINPMFMIRSLQQLFIRLGGLLLQGVSLEHWTDQGTHVELTIFGGYQFKASGLICATNGFAREMMPEVDVRAARNQVMVIRPRSPLKLRGCFHYHKGFVYFRHLGDLLLIGGGRHTDLENEFTTEMKSNEKIGRYLLDFVNLHILPEGNYEVVSGWPGILGLGTERKPIISKVSGNVVAAVRLSGIGIAIGTLVGEEAAGLMIQK